MSRSSRFNEEEDFASAASQSSSKGEDEEDLDLILTHWKCTCFMEDMAIGKSHSINGACASKGDNAQSVMATAPSPTDDKEEWKIRIFPC
ncbi:hypothetical protein [Parasitella parasitica]|uniref:Uncharacterized protein n=1 Tax=Parasitella parasitica TaxID=35722 RepID=A0A0B7NF96_9FUNG|nr:hypothetical protein [Parasitella parasitica]